MIDVMDIRNLFAAKYRAGEIEDNGTIEILGASFLASEPTIFGEVNVEYVDRELEWYHGCSLNVDDIPGDTPKIWREIAGRTGQVNSNYGHLLFSDANGRQMTHVLQQLRNDSSGRKATAIYTRPTMHEDAIVDGMNDFVCTNAVMYFVRDRKLHAVVQMRSNDVVFGYRNDYAWQEHILLEIAHHTGYQPGTITWQAASLHVYPRHFRLIEEFIHAQ